MEQFSKLKNLHFLLLKYFANVKMLIWCDDDIGISE